MRCVHESQLHEENAFLTLTYDDKHLPPGGTLIKSDPQKFMKRLRKHLRGKKISYFLCGEYGDQTRRPHYHALLFGHDFGDKQMFKRNFGGDALFTSAALSKLWPMGFATTAAVTFESAAYVARYCVKKITGAAAAQHYRFVHPETGEVTQLVPEFVRMSLKPAVGKEWFKSFSRDVFPSDEVIMRGRQMKPPKYYDKLLELVDAEAHALVKAQRLRDAAEHAQDSTTRRLREREEIKIAQTKNLKREIE